MSTHAIVTQSVRTKLATMNRDYQALRTADELALQGAFARYRYSTSPEERAQILSAVKLIVAPLLDAVYGPVADHQVREITNWRKS